MAALIKIFIEAFILTIKTDNLVTADVSDTTTDKPTHDVKEMATETRDNTVQDVTDSAITTNNPARVTTSIITKTTNIPTLFETDMKTELTTATYKAEDTQALETSRGTISGDKTGSTSALKTTTKYAAKTDTSQPTNFQTKQLPATFSKTENIDTSVGKLFDDENKGFIVIDKLQTIYPSTSDRNDRYSTNTLSYLLTSITPFGFSSVSSIQSNSAATSNSNGMCMIRYFNCINSVSKNLSLSICSLQICKHIQMRLFKIFFFRKRC